MVKKIVSIFTLSMGLAACSGGKQYRDTTELEMPPQLAITETTPSSGDANSEVKQTLKDSVFLDNLEHPQVLKIKKLFDRSWDIVGKALKRKKVEITDKNRQKGVYYVKYDPSGDSGERILGNVKFFFFEEDYQEGEYELTVAWNETETEVRARMLTKTGSADENQEMADGSEKLLKALYDTIREDLSQ